MTARPAIRALSLATAALLPVGLAVTPATASAARVVPASTRTLVAVDSGSGIVHGSWGIDDGYLGGSVVKTTAVEKAGEAPAAISEDLRSGEHFSYTIRHLTPGTKYTLRLHFVEPTATAVGQRVMDVTVGGQPAVTGLDVFSAAGGANIPVHRDVPVVADATGRVTVDLRGTTGEAVLSGYELIGAAPSTRLGNYLAPTNVVIKPTGPTATFLSWTSTPGVAQYAIKRNGKIVGRTGEDAFVDTGLKAGTTYRYQIAAVDPDGSLGTPTAPKRITMPKAALQATGAYHTQGSIIVGPDGKPFVPVGANLGTPYTMDYAGPALGHAKDAKAWGWNTVRLIINPRWHDSDGLDAIVKEYRAAGIVVILDAHHWWDSASAEAPANAEQVANLWRDLAPRFAGDSGVWYNLANEPGYISENWAELHQKLAKVVRDSGAKNIIIVDAPAWGQDLGNYGDWFMGNRFAYSPTMAPRLQATYGNVILDQHNYGQLYDTADKYGAYVDAVHRNGLPLIQGEFGYSTDGSTTAGSYAQNKAGAKAAFAVNPTKGVGTIVWNGNVGDRYSLKKDSSAFYSGTSPLDNISELGQDMWDLTHR